MFRNFYAEQKMTDPRDSWYKPNLLYNIHYRPPKPPTPPTPPKMMVVTKEFNPSVCTCGEHGCGPYFRMEREVVWSSKEVRKEEDKGKIQEKIQDDIDVNTKPEYEYSSENDRDSDDDDDDDDDDGDDGDGDGNDAGDRDEKCKSDAFSEDKLDDIKVYDMVRCESNDISLEKSQYDDNVNVGSSSDDTMKLEQNSNDVINEADILDSVFRLDDLTKPETPDIDKPDIGEPTVNLDGDDEEYGSAFGIMRVYCDSELHSSWTGNNKLHGH